MTHQARSVEGGSAEQTSGRGADVASLVASRPASARVATQTWAMLVDAYRELRARRLFWIVLVLSGVVVAVLGMLGINEEGITFLHWTFGGTGFWNSNLVSPATFYKFLFSAFAIPLWLGFVGMILAVISTASIFPDFLSSGSIDLYLSKPMSRLRLFLTKYLTGLLFVTLQVSVFTGLAFVVIGVRGGAWEPALFLAVPVVVLMFSYLFSVCTLFGVVTRSTIAAVLLTMVVWVAIAGINNAESALAPWRQLSVNRIDRDRNTLARLERVAARAENPGLTFQINVVRERIEQEQQTLRTLDRIYTLLWWAKLPLPKNAETLDLLRRALVAYADLPGETFSPADEVDLNDLPTTAPATQPSRGRERRGRAQEAEALAKQLADSRNLGWVLGTSLAFEAVMLSLAAWVFIRRDY